MDKLKEIGSRLGLSENDVETLKKERRRWPLMIGIISMVLSLLVFILGLILGILTKGTSNPISEGGGGGGYPYAVSGLALSRSSKVGFRKFHLPLIAILGFLTGISEPVFGGDTIDYGVFSRKERM